MSSSVFSNLGCKPTLQIVVFLLLLLSSTVFYLIYTTESSPLVLDIVIVDSQFSVSNILINCLFNSLLSRPNFAVLWTCNCFFSRINTLLLSALHLGYPFCAFLQYIFDTFVLLLLCYALPAYLLFICFWGCVCHPILLLVSVFPWNFLWGFYHSYLIAIHQFHSLNTINGF